MQLKFNFHVKFKNVFISERIRKERAKDVYFRNPQLKDIQGAEDFISSARKDVNTCEVTFTRPIHGE